MAMRNVADDQPVSELMQIPDLLLQQLRPGEFDEHSVQTGDRVRSVQAWPRSFRACRAIPATSKTVSHDYL